MANIVIPEIQGVQSPAATQQTSGYERGFGNQVEKPGPLAQATPGTFGDHSGDVAIGRAISQGAQTLEGLVAKQQALDHANDEANLELRKHIAAKNYLEAKTIAHQTSLESTKTPDEEHEAFKARYDELEEQTNKDPRFNFKTNLIADKWQGLQPALRDGYVVDHIASVVEPAKIDSFNASIIQSIQTIAQNAAQSSREQGGIDPETRKSARDAITGLLDSPQVRTALGERQAELFKQQQLKKLDTDLVGTLPPRAAIAFLENKDASTDLFVGMDVSDREQALRQQQQIARGDEQDARVRLNEAQAVTEFNLVDQISHAKSLPELARLESSVRDLFLNHRDELGGLDQGHAENAMRVLEANKDRIIRRQEAAAARSSAQQAHQDAVLAPFRYAQATGLPMDPQNAQNRQSADTAFGLKLKAAKIDQADGALVVAAGIQFAQQTGVIPTRALAMIAPTLRQPGQQAETLARQLAAIGQNNPGVMHNFDDFTSNVVQRIGAGYSSADAINGERELARIPQSTRSDMKEQAGKVYSLAERSPSNNLFVSTVKDLTFNGVPVGDAAARGGSKQKGEYGANMQAEAMFRQEFLHQLQLHPGDSATASRIAATTTLKNFQPTSIDGKPRLLQNAPEAQFGAQIANAAYIDVLKTLNVPPSEKWNYQIGAGQQRTDPSTGEMFWTYPLYRNGLPLVISGKQQAMAITNQFIKDQQAANDPLKRALEKRKASVAGKYDTSNTDMTSY
jgi:hypothetical protein